MTTDNSVEIELKLALPQQQAAAFIKLMARRRCTPIRQVLLTRYFDTPDFALSAQGLALRVRRVGRRWVQTLKTEGERRGGLSQRAEYEMPVTCGTPDWSRFPDEALERVPEALRAQLVPVFETDFHRTSWLIHGRGGALIEVALDGGEVRTLKGINTGKRSEPICEIELELKAGQPDHLFELAQGWARQLDCIPLDMSKAERGVRLAHGLSMGPVKSVPEGVKRHILVEAGFAAMCQSCLAQFQANLPGVLASDDIEYLHQARVALRRLRAVLRLFRKICAPPEALLDELRTLVATMGPARDWDVLCSEILPAIAPHDPDPVGWQQGHAALESHRAEVRAAMQAAIRNLHPGAWLLDFQRWLLQHGWRKAPEAQRFIQLSELGKWARKALQKGHRPILRGAREFRQLQPLQRHALRIAIKRQRYATEFFGPLFAVSEGKQRKHVRYLTLLQQAQDSLGRINDTHVAWGRLTESHVDAGAMRSFVLGWLAAQLVDAGPDSETIRLVREWMESPVYW